MADSPSWVIPGILARSPRPGYRGEGSEAVTAEEVRSWLEEVRGLGVRSAIVLLDDDQLAPYSSLPGGLIGEYRAQGLQVAHVPAPDHQTPPLSSAQLDRIWQSFTSLPKPVLVHCSAGIDRTGAAVQHIIQRLGGADRETAPASG